MDNSSYNGLDPPGTVKRNPTYLESPSASDMESMSVTMTLSAEDILSQVIGNCGSHNFCGPHLGRIIVMSPPVRVGRHIVFPLASVCLWVCRSVCLSVRHKIVSAL